MLTLDNAFNIFQKTKNLVPSSLRKEINRYNKHLKDYWKNFDLEKVEFIDILNFKCELFTRNLSAQSVKLCLSLTRRIMNRAHQVGVLKKKPPYFEMPAVHNQRTRYFTEYEAEQLFAYLKSKSELWHDIAFLAIHTGMRAGEILSIREECVSLENKSITLFKTKSGRTRNVPLNDCALEVIQKYSLRKLTYFFSNNEIREVSPLFRQAIKDLKFNENIENNQNRLVFHSLRHTFASWLSQKGVATTIVQDLLGHETIQMTLRYSHLAPEQSHNAVALLPSNLSTAQSQEKN